MKNFRTRFLLVLLFISGLSHTALAQKENWTDEGNYDITWYTDSTSATNYQITTAEQFAGLAVIVNGMHSQTAFNFKDRTISLANSIDLSEKFWTPIGDYYSPFRGTFSGNNDSIKGMEVEIIPITEVYAGLFGGILTGGKVENLHVQGSVSVSTSIFFSVYCGGLVGYNEGGIIQNSSYFGNLSVSPSSSSTVRCGGLVGYNYNGKIFNNYARGKVEITEGSTQLIGGIAGYHEGDSRWSIQNNYFEGSLTSTLATNQGGIVGQNASSDANIQNNYWKDSKGTTAIIGGGTTSGTNIANNSAFTEKGKIDPAIHIGAGETGDAYDNLLAALNAWVTANGTDYKSWKKTNVLNDDYPIYSDMVVPNWIDYANFDWYELGKTAYTISTPEELAGLAAIVNNYNLPSGVSTENFRDKTITLANNIDLSGKLWTPIGNYNNFFQGTFSGNNDSIKGMEVEIISTSAVYAGLFGCVRGIVKDLQLQGRVSATSSDQLVYCGGLLGYNANGTVQNCSHSGDITASNSSSDVYCGGLLGYNQGIAQNSSHSGNVTASSTNGNVYCGGLVGYSQGGATTVVEM